MPIKPGADGGRTFIRGGLVRAVSRGLARPSSKRTLRLLYRKFTSREPGPARKFGLGKGLNLIKKLDFVLMATLAGLAGAIIPVCLSALFIGLLVFGMWLADRTPEAEYYRALYDVCMARRDDAPACLRIVADLKEKQLYKIESPGWVWPLPVPQLQSQPPKGDLNNNG